VRKRSFRPSLPKQSFGVVDSAAEALASASDGASYSCAIDTASCLLIAFRLSPLLLVDQQFVTTFALDLRLITALYFSLPTGSSQEPKWRQNYFFALPVTGTHPRASGHRSPHQPTPAPARLRASLPAQLAATMSSGLELMQHARRQHRATMPTTVGAIDELLGGGLPKGSLVGFRRAARRGASP